MFDIALEQNTSNNAIYEMCTFITDQRMGCPKTREDIFLQKLRSYRRIIFAQDIASTQWNM